MSSPLQRAVDRFAARFGQAPRFASAAPGRVNLIGEHTDYNGGYVLPVAIDRETVIVASPVAGDDEPSTLVAADLGREITLDLSRPLGPIPRQSPHAFANYVTGVVQQFHELGAAPPNLRAVVASSVPLGAGLASSASVEVAMATLLEAVTGRTLTPVEKALLCQRAEHAFPGTPCGIMDMFISVMAVEGAALAIDCLTNECAPIPLPPADEMTLLIADTGVKHNLAGGAYAERRAACEAAARKLGVPTLREATLEMIESGGLTDLEAKRATHVVTENARVALAIMALVRGRIDEFCARMFESHDSLRDLYEVSCPELDLLVNSARQLARSAGDRFLGARMTGGGFGGCAIVYCRAGVASSVSEFLTARFQMEFGREPRVFAARASGGAGLRRVEH